MLTGDAVAIAKETCRQLALGDKVYDSERLLGGGMSGAEITDFLEAADGFGEVFPEHKYQVVEMLKQRGHLVGMTGGEFLLASRSSPLLLTSIMPRWCQRRGRPQEGRLRNSCRGRFRCRSKCRRYRYPR